MLSQNEEAQAGSFPLHENTKKYQEVKKKEKKRAIWENHKNIYKHDILVSAYINKFINRFSTENVFKAVWLYLSG